MAYKFILPMNEGQGMVLYDKSGIGNHGLNYGDWAYTRYGKAVYLSSDSNFVTVPHDPTLNITSQVTLEGLLKIGEESPGSEFPADPAGWSWKRAITISPATPVDHYQIKIVLTTSNFDYTHANADGSDLRFYTTDDVKLPYWIEQWDPTGTSTIWVKVTSSNTDMIYMYYGNPSASSESDGNAVFDFFDDFTGEGTDGWNPYKYPSNPVAPFAHFARVVKDGETWHMYYSCSSNVCHATSSDGINWTEDTDNNPILTPSTSGWDEIQVWGLTPIKVGENDWHALYTGRDSSGYDRIGHATSTDGVHWTKDTDHNPVMEPTETWEEDKIEIGSIILVDSTIYCWYHQPGGAHRDCGLATSTDWINWSKDSNNPIFEGTSGDFYHAFSPGIFKYNNKYYIVIAYYSSVGNYAKFRLYEDTNPTFYPSDRTDLGWYLSGEEAWEALDMDTFRVPPGTPIVDNKIYAYYSAADSGNTWKEGLLQIPTSNFPGPNISSLSPDADKWEIDAQPTHFSVDNNVLKIDSSGEENIIRTKDFSGTDCIIEMKWKFTNWQAHARTGVLARYQDSNNFYAVWLANLIATGNEKGMICAKRVGGTWTEGTDYSNFDWDLDTWYNVKFIVEGNNLRGYFEDELKCSATFTDFSSGKVGIRTWYSDVEIDNFRVRKYASPEPSTTVGTEEEAGGGEPSVNLGALELTKGSAYGIGINGSQASAMINNNVITGDISPQVWNHVIMTYDGSSQKLYVNGQLRNSQSLSGAINTNTNSFEISTSGGPAYCAFARLNDNAFNESEVKTRFAEVRDYTQMLYNCYGCDDGLVLYLPMHEGQGSVAGDQSGKGNDGMIHNANWTNVDEVYRLYFNGSNAYVDCGNDASLPGGNTPVTYLAWVKISAEPLDIPWEGYGIVGWNLVYPHGLLLHDTKEAYMNIRTDTGLQGVLSTTILEVGEWYFLAGIFNGSNEVGIYVNGVRENTRSITGTPVSPSSMYIGRSSSYYLNGIIDSVRIYNRALSEREISYHYQNQLPNHQ